MSVKHPIIAITGSSGAGTTSVMRTFEQIFRREGVKRRLRRGRQLSSLRPRGDEATDGRSARGRGNHISAISGPRPTCSRNWRNSFGDYGETGRGRTAQIPARRRRRPRPTASEPGPSRPGRTCRRTPICCSTKVCTAPSSPTTVDIAQHVDLLIGVVPVINLEWIQKLHRDKAIRGYSTEAVTDTILRRMHDYVHYICPQFSRTHVNFQRVPMVDTSNPFVARFIPTAGRSRCW